MPEIVSIARVGTKPELKLVGEDRDKKVAEFRVNLLNVRKKGEEYIDRSYWATVHCWGASAEGTAKLFSVGDRIVVIGAHYQDRWEKDGEQQATMVVDARLVLPFTPDLQQLQYKPRKSSQESSAPSDDASADDSSFDNQEF
ncbi:single-stranded DNA-binding protein [Hahella ganghwensis]|uniref:single-stranded DNA-binding protein n=1 Tax=Hahella ganghwensis TaxID=286420 RepID=UPI00037F200D|nr:single-stranded DNA-binding protein [Hahella ganghwensis]